MIKTVIEVFDASEGELSIIAQRLAKNGCMFRDKNKITINGCRMKRKTVTEIISDASEGRARFDIQTVVGT